MYDRILLPTDGGDHAAAAAAHALDLAATYGATLHAVFVIDTGTSALAVSKVEVRDVLEELGEARSREALDAIRSRAADAGVELVVDVLEGDPDERIVDYATDHAVDLVVMGTHGRTGLERYLTGSVAEGVVRDSPAPVMTVSTPADRDASRSEREP
ncbi:universal stress protein [Candidatus Halobonum tyrrellensis]|uniref:Universal stress protein uspa-like protein n=1 Tax=Candidatus Halobonum tyrrellensis G22 TaxID=1324957 RepID=V4HF86_9EURY|nr:universal stress protein [Candidatus Halobonum tyrrellensis]ESP89335.1 universal stress protein uspa-like protein [Candidatus Halobonum tyrrellensis G22]